MILRSFGSLFFRILGSRCYIGRLVVAVMFMSFLCGMYSMLQMNYTNARAAREVSKSVLQGLDLHSTNKNNVKKKRQNVILLTHMSSGSTFVGNIFNLHPDVFFLFEPLHGLRREGYGDELVLLNQTQNQAFRADFSRLLRDVFSCEFEDAETLKWIIPPWLRKPFMLWRLATPNKSKETVQKACLKSRITVAKIMQTRLPWPNGIQELMQACGSAPDKFDCRIIHLVRDPRAVLSSLVRRAFFHGGLKRKLILSRPISEEGLQLIKKYAHLLCSQVEDNIQFVKQLPSWFNNRYQLFRYEDIILNPLNATMAMYNFLGLPMAERIMMWLTGDSQPTQINKEIMYTFSLVQNPQSVVNKWRTEQDPSMISVFEEGCLPVMKLTGYRPTQGSKSLQHDLDKSLLE